MNIYQGLSEVQLFWPRVNDADYFSFPANSIMLIDKPMQVGECRWEWRFAVLGPMIGEGI